jgi:uncharacterized protein YecE (DUF72 family)
VFAVKANRAISHLKRLRHCEPEVADFLEAARGSAPSSAPSSANCHPILR